MAETSNTYEPRHFGLLGPAIDERIRKPENVCDLCGAVVADMAKHKAWHDDHVHRPLDRDESIPADHEWCDDCGWRPPGEHVARLHEDDDRVKAQAAPLTVRLDRWASRLRNDYLGDPLNDDEAMELSTLLTEAANSVAHPRMPSINAGSNAKDVSPSEAVTEMMREWRANDDGPR